MQGGQPLEMIQARTLLSRLNTAGFLVDTEGTLVYYNDAAAELLGMSFKEAGAMPAGTWGTRWAPREPGGPEIPVGDLPLAIAVQSGRPAYSPMVITGATGEDHEIEVSAFPICGGNSKTQYGSVAIFWPVDEDED
jgi:PAS domain-containing protein